MALDYETIEALRRHHPAWKLLRSDHSTLICAFLHKAFTTANKRSLAQSELMGRLEDELYRLRENLGIEAFPRSAAFYLDEWAEDNKGWLRKFYPPGKDEPHFDLTPATEKTLLWLESLLEKSFLGTESRVLSVFEILQQLVTGTETDPVRRLAELEEKRENLEREIARVKRGEIILLDETAVRDRFQLAATTARELLSDFRGVESNFRTLDRQARELITSWEGTKGDLVGSLLDQREAIAESDQGKNFRAFWDFLMDPRKQDQLSELLEKVYALEPIKALDPDPQGRRIHYAWMEAGEQTQRTVALLSQQLRRFLDDQVWLENRRIMEILRSVEQKAVSLRLSPPAEMGFMELEASSPRIPLPMERQLHSPVLQGVIEDLKLEAGVLLSSQALYDQSVVDRLVLKTRIRKFLEDRDQGTLAQVLERFPLEQGLAELVAYLDLASQDPHALVEDQTRDEVVWDDEFRRRRKANLPRIIFRRHP